MEEETITLVLEISKPRNVTWLCAGNQVSGERFKIGVDETGLKHTLTVVNITLDENAEFTVQIDDQSYGVVTSNCQVTVKGVYQYFFTPTKSVMHLLFGEYILWYLGQPNPFVLNRISLNSNT